MPGDEKYKCKTMPIVWGVSNTKKYIAAWLLILIGVLGIIQVYVLQFSWWWPVLYCIVLIIGPLVGILMKLFKVSSPNDYHTLDNHSYHCETRLFFWHVRLR